MKLNRKWILVMSLVLSVAMATTGTLAYLTDSDSEVNVMTVGRVKVELNELQRNDDQTALEDFEQGKVAMPYVNTSEKDSTFNLIKEKSHIDKIVYATNTGNSDAYMRILVAIPAWANTTDDQSNANNNNLHWNYPGDTTSGKIQDWLETNMNVVFDENADELNEYKFEKVVNETVTIGGKEYTVWSFTFNSAIAAGKSTNIVLTGLYLDKRVDYDADTDKYLDINSKPIVDFDGTIYVPVLVQAVQASGFDTADAALNEAFGEKTVDNAKKWFGTVKAPTKVSTAAELTAALNAGESVMLSDDIEVNGNITLRAGAALYGNGHTLSDVQLYMNEGSTVENVVFDGTEENNGSQIYAHKVSVTIKDCTFRNANWDAIQATPDHGDEIVIDGCTFAANTAKNGQARSIHIEVDASSDSDNDGVIDRADKDFVVKLTLTNNYFDMTQSNVSNWNNQVRITNETTISGLQPENITASGNTMKILEKSYSDAEKAQMIGFFHREVNEKNEVALVSHAWNELKSIFGVTTVK